MSEEKDLPLPEVKADKKGFKKEEPVKETKTETTQSKSCSCGCQEKLQKLIEAVSSNKLIKIELSKLGLI